MNPLLRSVYVPLFKQRMFSHSFLSEGVKYNKELMTNKYVYYKHTEKYSPKSYVVNFRTQIGSSQSEERTMVFTRAKMIRPIKIANDVFSRGRKMIRPIRSHRGVSVSRQNSRLLLQLAAPLRTHSTRKVLLKEFFSL